MSTWKQTIYEHGGSRIITEDADGGNRDLIADTYQPEHALLFMNAPEMLDILRQVADDCECRLACAPTDSSCPMNKARAIIAKVEAKPCS